MSRKIITTQAPAHAGPRGACSDRDGLLCRRSKGKRDTIRFFIVAVIARCLTALKIPLFRNFFGIAASV